MFEPDKTTPQEQLKGVNVPEFYTALTSAAAYAHGYYHVAMIVWRDRKNKRRFAISKRPNKPTKKGDWEKITTVTPHGGFSD